MEGYEEPFETDPPDEQVPATSFYGQTCVKCNVPIHYSYETDIEGYCGKCTDGVRNQILEGHRANLERDLIGNKLPEVRSGGGLRTILLILAVGIVVFLGTLAFAAYQPDLWEKLVAALNDLLRRE